MAYTWLESYITGRAQIIHVGNHHSSPSKVLYGVPQGSVLGPVLYVLYTSDVAKLVEALGLGAHLYADDTQLYGHGSPSNSVELASRVLRAIDSIHEWMSSNRLSLNTSKTQFIWLGTKHSLAKRDTDRLFSLHPSLTELTSVRNLGFIIDQELSMKDHINLPNSPQSLDVCWGLTTVPYQRWWLSEWVTPGGTAIPGMTSLKDGDLQHSSALARSPKEI